MPQTFKINLLNGGSPIHFGFFQAQPEIAHDQGNADSIWTNVWFQQTCASGGQITVLLEEQFYSCECYHPDRKMKRANVPF